jgi:hypothetical protein
MSALHYVSDLEPVENLSNYSRYPLPELATADLLGTPLALAPTSLPLAQKEATSVNGLEQRKADRKGTAKLHKAKICVSLGVFILLLSLLAGLLGGLLPKVNHNAST